MSNVLETSGVGIDIQDITLSGDFTVEFSVFLSPTTNLTNENPIFSGDIGSNDIHLHMTDGRTTLTTSNQGDVLVSPIEVGVGEWHQFALVRGPGHNRVSLYVDGNAEVGSASGIGGDVTLSLIHI